MTKQKQPPLANIKIARDPYRIIGTVLAGKYELLEYAGGGGMGAVYQALSLVDRKPVAVKILKPDIVARNPEYAELFEKEVRTAQSLKHPNIVEVYDGGEDDGLSYMVMEWIEGKSIEDVWRQRRLPIQSIIKIFEQICSAVSFAHEKHVIHLDIKPSNILLLERKEPEHSIKVIDFGLSKIISRESGTTMTRFRGTHQYCAPEQFGGKVSHRSDIYSLGATLYYLITGVIPFGASYINAKIHPNLELPQIPSVTRQCDVSFAVDRVITKALNKNPDLRQRSAKHLFEEFLDSLTSSERSVQNDWEQDEPPEIELTRLEFAVLALAIAGPVVLLVILIIIAALFSWGAPDLTT